MSTEAMFVAHTRVVSTSQPCRGFRRIVLAGEDLEHASADLLGTLPPGVPDLHAIYRGSRPRRDAYVKVLVPPPGGVSADPDLSAGFRAGFTAVPEDERGWMRTYTVRSAGRTRVDGREVPALTIDVVLHGDPDDAADPHQGPGLRWARTVAAGESVNVLVPTGEAPAWAGWRDTGARRVLAVGDATAAPALLSVAEELADPFGGFDGEADLVLELPADAELADLIAERLAVPEPWDESRPLDVAEHGRVRLHVGRTSPGRPVGAWAQARLGTLLGLRGTARAGVVGVDGVVEAPPAEGAAREWTLADLEPVTGVDRPDTYVFLAGESGMVRALRRLAVDGGDIPKKNVSFMGYWRQGQAES
ncbi:siderophore-interacting protein [Micrococcus sp. ACRRV]|uniref:siderophore-interacting protein n=1 Tax=Micrococcus sp. ACRRV TaxID=2918203 RepID=UPI001EF2159D|nr:siderophore-interacting protein [Micrococcus sp. ACRRV]MCG7422539.1 siderophore-interacting protein [Micrococcus sp. ACRRV]